ncbi:type I polyketide synthase [Streptomyces sp. WMMC897]|uniref:type I polyketide synthase n=1 Tax=Streptomyces sp. WMMC897 TaxID=3014782 RepID=UPI0022B6BB73|nr:type I polyketide synthase [Streptomyces sp. WMMC897]MCZ7416624.1 type I polyketide synthase [Streptomyces sp. WMMC897]
MRSSSTGMGRDSRRAAEPIAIVGIGCRFPGADHPDALWTLLLEGRDEITTVPADRFDVDAYFDPRPSTPGRTHSRWGGFVSDLRGFDAKFFGISPREAERMDPQQRMLLETAWDGLRDAGLAPRNLAGSRTGVYMGMIASNYWELQDRTDLNVYSVTGTSYAVLSGRLSYQLDLRGPSLTLDTACSSSLVAVHLACQSLRHGESELAIAGGVNAVLLPDEGVAYSSAGMLSTHGRCKFADTDGNGFVRSDGVGIVILKRLSQALKDRDRVYAVIAGSACNNDGQGSGYLLTPAESGQVELLSTALHDSGVEPSELDYVEAHGTGTSVGDAVELRALSQVLAGHRTEADPCLVGSIKTNIGHAEAAAGVAGLIKAAFSVHHARIPASLHLENPNPALDWETAPLRVPTEATAWPQRPGGATTAGVSAFGISGTNAHVVLRRPDPAPASRGRRTGPGTLLLPVSAASGAACRTLAGEYARMAEQRRRADVRRLCVAAARRSDHYAHRVAVTAPDPEALAAALTEAAERDDPGYHAEPDAAPGIVFVFPGQGSQWIGMGRDLMRCWPVFRSALRACDKAIHDETGWSVLDVLARGTSEDLERIEVVQPLLWAMEVALARLWESFGVTPRAVIGHSMGEVAAAHVSGALSLADSARVICRRSRLASEGRGMGAMAVIDASADDVERLLAENTESGTVCVAAHNSPYSTVVSGDAEAVAAVVGQATGSGTGGRLIRVDFASHSPHMDPLREGLLRQLDDLSPGPTRIRMHSTVHGRDVDGSRLDARYWADNLRQPVHFAEGIAALAAESPTLFLEVSPHPVLLASLNACLGSQDSQSGALASVSRDEPEDSGISDRVAELYQAGVEIDWSGFYPGPVPHVGLPRYPWEREEFWVSPATDQSPSTHAQDTSGPTPAPHHHPLLGRHEQQGPVHRWEGTPDPAAHDRLRAHQVQGAAVFPATAYLELAQAAHRRLSGESVSLELQDVRFRSGLYLQPEPPTLRTDVDTSQVPWTFSVSSAQPEGDWLVHATGTLAPASAPPATVDLDAVLDRCTTVVPGAEFYALNAARGNDWQGDFRCLTRLWTGPGELLAVLRTPPRPTQDDSAYHFDPALLDAGCHVLAALTEQLGSSRARGAFLGTLIETVRLHRSPEPKLLSHAVLHREADGTLRGDIHLLTTGGAPVADLLGVTSAFVEQLPASTTERPTPRDVSDWLLSVDWRETPASPPSTNPPAHWLLVTDDDAAARHLPRCLPGDVTVAPYSSDVGDRTGFDELLRERQQVAPVRLGVVFVPAPDHSRRWERPANNPSHQLARLLRVLAAFPASAQLWVVTQDVQAAVPGDSVSQPAAAPLWGMARTAALELPELGCTLIDLPEQPEDGDWWQLSRELLGDSGEDQIALRRGRRLVARLQPTALPATTQPAHPDLLIRPDAGYLITGGLGALGRLAAQWLIDHGARNILLTGRTPLPSPDEPAVPDGHPLAEALHTLRDGMNQGLHVEYHSVDVADRVALADLLHHWREAGRPRIRGVLHTAGIATESSLADLSRGELDALLHAKLQGGWALHHTIGQEPLDFFALYSSAASMISSPMLGGYAAANAALDALAHYRNARGLPAVSIQWGFWNEVGMDARQESRSGRTRKPAGVRGVHTRAGCLGARRDPHPPDQRAGHGDARRLADLG